MKKKTGTILATVAIGASVLMSAGAIIKLTKNETTKTVAGTAFSWEVGGLNAETGKKSTATNTIRTKDYISIADFKVDVDEEQESSYVLYLYDRDKAYLGCTTEIKADYTFADDYAGADKAQVAYAKVLISVDDDDISAFELPGYVDQYKITVKK